MLKILISTPKYAERRILEILLPSDGGYIPLSFDTHKTAITNLDQLGRVDRAVVDLDEADSDELVSKLAESFPKSRILGVSRKEKTNTQCYLNVINSSPDHNLYDAICQLRDGQ